MQKVNSEQKKFVVQILAGGREDVGGDDVGGGGSEGKYKRKKLSVKC